MVVVVVMALAINVPINNILSHQQSLVTFYLGIIKTVFNYTVHVLNRIKRSLMATLYLINNLGT